LFIELVSAVIYVTGVVYYALKYHRVDCCQVDDLCISEINSAEKRKVSAHCSEPFLCKLK